jgi:hypothetical protein
VSVFAGYVQYRIRLEETQGAARWATVDIYDRGVVRLGAGLAIHMSPSAAFGIRFDQNFPFAGTHCRAEQPIPTSAMRDYAECTPIDEAEGDLAEGLPFFWEVSIHAMETFDIISSARKRAHRRAKRREKRAKRQRP